MDNIQYEKSSKVFISYSWAEQEYGCDWVADLAAKLRDDGIEVDIDLFHESPSEGWTTWIINQINNSDFVLILCTQSYYNTVNKGETIDQGNGRRFEGKIIQTKIYGTGCINDRFIPILPPNGNRKNILEILQDSTAYYVYNDYKKLVNRLRGEGRQVSPLRKREIKTLFSALIDPVLWKEALWSGMAYVTGENEVPICVFMFQNIEPTCSVFKQLQDKVGKGDKGEEVGLSFIENKEQTGYYTHIYPNIVKKIEENEKVHINKGITLSNVHEMKREGALANLQLFKKNFEIFNACYIAPGIKLNSSVSIAEKLKILCRNVTFRRFDDIKQGDADYIVHKIYSQQKDNE